MTKIIGVSGSKGSFSEEAALCYCQKQKIEDYELRYLVSVENVLSALDVKEADLGIFPIENSNGGIVYEAVYAMAKHNFNIDNFFEIDIRHNLLSLPDIEKEGINKIASHQQALRQCRMYLRRSWPEAELIEWEDTAKAALDLKEGRLSINTAVIAPFGCAEMYGLKVLEERIQDLKFNFTTFLAVSRYAK